MFEHIADRPRTHRTWPALLFSISIVGHAAGGVALLLVAMWQIDRLAPPERQITTISLASPPMNLDEPPPPSPIKKLTRPIHASKPVRELVQSDRSADDQDQPEVDIEYEVTAESGNDQGTGHGTSPAGLSIGDDDDRAPMVPMEVHEPPVPPPARTIPAHMLKGKRIAGNEQIRPPENVRIAMLRAGARRIKGSVKMCLDRQGRVASVETLESTGYENYDRQLLREMRSWRYRPYQASGDPVPVCTPIVFIYEMTD